MKTFFTEQIAALEQELAETQTAVEQGSGKLRSEQRARSDLERRLQSLQLEEESARSSLESERRSHAELTEKLRQRTRVEESFKVEIRKLQSAAEDTKADAESTQSELEFKVSQIERLKKALEKTKGLLASARDEVLDQQSAGSSEATAYKRQAEQARTNLAAAKEQISKLGAELVKAKAAAEQPSARAPISTLPGELRIELSSDPGDEEQGDNALLIDEAELDMLRSEADALKQETASAKAKAAAAQRQTQMAIARAESAERRALLAESAGKDAGGSARIALIRAQERVAQLQQSLSISETETARLRDASTKSQSAIEQLQLQVTQMSKLTDSRVSQQKADEIELRLQLGVTSDRVRQLRSEWVLEVGATPTLHEAGLSSNPISLYRI